MRSAIAFCAGCVATIAAMHVIRVRAVFLEYTGAPGRQAAGNGRVSRQDACPAPERWRSGGAF